MRKAYYWIKSVVLFLFGIVLVVWGYQVNASSSDKKKAEKKSTPSVSEEKDSVTSDVNEEVQIGNDSVSNNPSSEKKAVSTQEESPEQKPKKNKKKTEKSKRTETKEEPKVENKESKATKTEIESGEKAEEASGTK